MRSDGQYYRDTRRKHMLRAFARRGNFRFSLQALFALAVWLAGSWAMRHGFNVRLVKAVNIGVPVALIVIDKVLEFRR